MQGLQIRELFKVTDSKVSWAFWSTSHFALCWQREMWKRRQFFPPRYRVRGSIILKTFTYGRRMSQKASPAEHYLKLVWIFHTRISLPPGFFYKILSVRLIPHGGRLSGVTIHARELSRLFVPCQRKATDYLLQLLKWSGKSRDYRPRHGSSMPTNLSCIFVHFYCLFCAKVSSLKRLPQFLCQQAEFCHIGTSISLMLHFFVSIRTFLSSSTRKKQPQPASGRGSGRGGCFLCSADRRKLVLQLS